MNAKEFTNVYTEWQRALNPNITLDKLWFNGSSADRPLPENAGNGTDWFKEITRSGAMNNHRININGGSESSTYSVSLHYLEHKGIILGSGFNRLGLNISNQFNILKWLNAGIDAYVASSSKDNSNENVNTSSAGANTHSALHEAAKMSPATPVFNENGLYFENTLPASVTMENPIASAKEVENIGKEFNAFGKLFFEFNPVKNLKIKLSGGANRTESKSYFYNPTTTIYGKLKGGEASLAQNSTSYLINENTVSYNTIVNESHKFDVVAGFTYEQEVREIFANSATGFFTDFYKYNNLQAATIYGTPSSNKNQWQLASFISRINYIYQQKYLFTFTSRYDGSSKFGGDNKWGFFPSAAIAWRLSEESFMKQFKDLSNLKIRASIGTTGNSNIGLYQSLPSFGLANYPLGTSIQSGVAATRLENKELKWETTQVINFGIDVTFIQNINVVLDLYKKNTNDLLYSVPLIETSGYSSILRNVGSLENRGIEIGVTAPIIDKGFSWSISGMFSMNRNEITKLTGDASLDWRIGNPLGAKRGYRVDGIINDQAELDNYVNEEGNPINNAKLGDWKIVDVNGDGKIDSEDMKNEIIFDPNPDFTYSISNDFAYKNFGLSVFIQGMQGNQILNANRTFFFTALDQVRSNLSRDVLNSYWTPDSKYDVKYARLGSPTYSQIYLQNGFAENGSFIKIQNISLSYQVPIKKVSSGMKIYLSAENVYTFTKYSGFDPDISSTTGNDDFGIDQNSYPMPRNYTFGIELTF
jgi:TonB-linked SusC/RagA family outer membrane protein